MIEKGADDEAQLHVLFRRSKGDELQEHAAWVVRFDDYGAVSAITDDDGYPVARERTVALNDVLWHFHRLAAEDVASVQR